MSTPATDLPRTEAHEPCAACGAPLSHDQRYCLHCGEVRAGARRPMPAALRGPIDAPAERVVARERDAPVGPSIAAVLAGLACLLLAMGVGVLIGRSGGQPAAQAPVTIAAAGAAPEGASFTSDWPAAKDGWTVALTLLPKATTTPAAVAQAKTAAQGKGAPAVGALDADAYPSLTGGSYVVYSGVFDSEKAATHALMPLTAAFHDARVVRVGAAAGAAPVAGAPSTSTSKAPAAGSAAKKKGTSSSKSSGASDTTKAFEKSKKAPKTVGTGGTPPPKDNKPAAAGGGFQEIG